MIRKIQVEIFIYFLVGKGLSKHDVGGGQEAPYFRRYGRGAGFETGDFVKEMLGGATVVRP